MTPEQTAPAADPSALARRDAADPLAVGDVDAPVVLINYSDYQCPYCAKFAHETMPTLQDRYIDTGLLRVEWRDFAYQGPESVAAARAARAAGIQGRYWDYHDRLFADQKPANSGHLSEKYLTGIAADLGLDVAAFRTDMNNPETGQAVGVDISEAERIGIQGTPTLLVNGRPVVGAQPTEVFIAAIDEALAAADTSR